MSMNETVDGKLTLGIADFDLSADVFSDPGYILESILSYHQKVIIQKTLKIHLELYFQNGSETTDEPLANPGDSNAIDMSGDMSGEGSGEGPGTDDIESKCLLNSDFI